jgi:hypothetical protein
MNAKMAEALIVDRLQFAATQNLDRPAFSRHHLVVQPLAHLADPGVFVP